MEGFGLSSDNSGQSLAPVRVFPPLMSHGRVSLLNPLVCLLTVCWEGDPSLTRGAGGLGLGWGAPSLLGPSCPLPSFQGGLCWETPRERAQRLSSAGYQEMEGEVPEESIQRHPPPPVGWSHFLGINS